MEKYTLKSIEGKLILLATILASGMAFLDGTVVNIAIPVIQKKLGASLMEIEWVINLYALMLASLILISGSLGDRFGRRKIFTLGIGLFTFSSFLCSISGSILQLTIFRGIQGIGAAMMIPGSLSIINSCFQESGRGKVIGLWSGFAGGLAALGPFLGGFLVQNLGWPSIFYINIPFGILALFISLRFVPESKHLNSGKLDFLGTFLIFLGLLGVVYGLITGPGDGWSSPLSVISLILGIALSALFIFTELRVKNPLVPMEIFKSPLVTGANLATLFLYFALSGLVFFLVLNFQQVQHYSPIFAGLGMLPAILLITFLSGPGGSLADKIGPRMPMILGSLIVCLGMILLILPGRGANYFISFMPGLILFGLGMSLVIAPLTKSALSVESKFSGVASGINNATSRLASVLAVAFLGGLVIFQFSGKLDRTLNSTNLSFNKKQEIIVQQNKLGAIEIPETFDSGSKISAQSAIEDSFIYSFRWAMGICAFLAFLAALVSFLTIKEKRQL